MDGLFGFALFLVFCQAAGALIGACSAVWGEWARARALRDGRIDAAERAHLAALARGLRYGMSLLLVSSCALVVVAYAAGAPRQPAVTSGYWTFITLALVIIGASWALFRRRISFELGSAAAFTAWWFMAYLALGRLPALSFGAAMLYYAVATGVFYFLLRVIRFLNAGAAAYRHA